MRDPLNGDWIQGYTQAIQDIKEMLPGLAYDFKFHKKQFNVKRMDEYLEQFLEHREELREGLGFLRYNSQLDKIEYFYNPNRWHGR